MLPPIVDDARWSPEIDVARGRRTIAGFPVVVHSQHFARLQHTIMTVRGIAGPTVLRDAARRAFAPLLACAVPQCSDLAPFAALFAALGHGRLVVTGPGVVESHSAHAAHAWVAAFGEASTPACATTEGFLEAAFAAMGRPCAVREIACIAAGASHCRFLAASASPGSEVHAHGGGQCTAYGQSVATLPATFFGLLGQEFFAAMDGIGQLALARDLLAFDSEDAVMRMFAGVLRSREWTSRPEPADTAGVLAALLTIARELGWGPWRLESFVAGPQVRLHAPGAPRWLHGEHDPSAALAGGAAAGLCELVLCEGAIDERFGALQIATQPQGETIAVTVGVDDSGCVPGGLAA